MSSNRMKTLDEEEFNRISNRLNELEANSRKIYKLCKEYSEILIKLNRIEVKLCDDLSESSLFQSQNIFNTENSGNIDNVPLMRTLIEEWLSFNSNTNRLVDDFGVILQKTFIEPLKRFDLTINELKVLLKKSEQIKQEYKKLEQKLIKLTDKEKTGQNIVKLEQTKQSLIKLEDEYKSMNEQLLEGIPSFIDYRYKYFQASLEAFIKTEIFYWGETLKNYNQSFTSSSENDVTALMNYLHASRNKQNQLLNQISSLSIVNTDG